MSPITHLLISWSAANITNLNKKERTIVTIAGVIPDIDGIGIIADIITKNTGHPLYLWNFHHTLGHNIGFAVFIFIMAFFLSNSAFSRRWVTAIIAFIIFHLHLLCDLIGSRGPDGGQWEIPYLLPFSDIWQLTWSGQWRLNAAPNFVITAIFLIITFYLAWKHGYSPLEIISQKIDNLFAAALRRRFGNPHVSKIIKK